jgi:hypothetical protein
MESGGLERNVTRIWCCLSDDMDRTEDSVLWEEDHEQNSSSSDQNTGTD